MNIAETISQICAICEERCSRKYFRCLFANKVNATKLSSFCFGLSLFHAILGEIIVYNRKINIKEEICIPEKSKSFNRKISF